MKMLLFVFVAVLQLNVSLLQAQQSPVQQSNVTLKSSLTFPYEVKDVFVENDNVKYVILQNNVETIVKEGYFAGMQTTLHNAYVYFDDKHIIPLQGMIVYYDENVIYTQSSSADGNKTIFREYNVKAKSIEEVGDRSFDYYWTIKVMKEGENFFFLINPLGTEGESTHYLLLSEDFNTLLEYRPFDYGFVDAFILITDGKFYILTRDHFAKTSSYKIAILNPYTATIEKVEEIKFKGERLFVPWMVDIGLVFCVDNVSQEGIAPYKAKIQI